VTFWNGACQFYGVLRITVTTSDEKIFLKLEGRLAGPWVDELKKTVLSTDAWCQPLEIDVSGLTFAEDEGEQILSRLHRMGARFQGKGPFPEYLCDRLKIPLSHQETVNHNTFVESRTTGIPPPKRTGAKRKR